MTVALVDATKAAEVDFVAGIWQAKRTAVAAVTPAATEAAGTSSDAVAQYTKTADAIATESVRLTAGYQETFKRAAAQATKDYKILVAKIDGEQAIDAASEEHLTALILNPEVNAEDRATVDAVQPLHVESTTILGWLSDAFATETFQTKVQHALIDLSAGVIDVLTGNATKNLRYMLGVEWLVDQSSWAYTAGQAAGIGISFAAGFFTGGAGWALLGVEAAGGVFSYVYVGIYDPEEKYTDPEKSAWFAPENMLNLMPAGVTGLGIAARFAPKGMSAVRNLFAHSDDVARSLSRADDVARRLGPKGAVGDLVLQSARRDAWRSSFGKPSEGLGQLVRDLPKHHQARQGLARMIREIRASGGQVSSRGLSGGIYGEFIAVDKTAVFRYQRGKLRIVDFLEEQVHWQQITRGQYLRTYGTQNVGDIMEILAKQRVLQHPELTPVLRMEWLDDLARVHAGQYGA